MSFHLSRSLYAVNPINNTTAAVHTLSSNRNVELPADNERHVLLINHPKRVRKSHHSSKFTSFCLSFRYWFNDILSQFQLRSLLPITSHFSERRFSYSSFRCYGGGSGDGLCPSVCLSHAAGLSSKASHQSSLLHFMFHFTAYTGRPSDK